MNQAAVAITESPTQEFPPAGSFARYASLGFDPKAYADIQHEGRRRKIIRMISRAPDAPIQVRHNFQIGSIDSSQGNGPPLHAHDYPEIFIPIRSSFSVDFGHMGRHRAQLGLYDTFSIPVDVLRKFEATEVAPSESQMISIFDTAMDDARHGIKVSPEVAAADIAAGRPQEFEISTDLLDSTPEEAEKKHIARFDALKVEFERGMQVRRVVSSRDPRAALRATHNIEVDFLELEPGSTSQEWRSDCREVFVPLEGAPEILMDGQALSTDRLDVLSVAPAVSRAIRAGEARALLIRVRDLTNAV